MSSETEMRFVRSAALGEETLRHTIKTASNKITALENALKSYRGTMNEDAIREALGEMERLRKSVRYVAQALQHLPDDPKEKMDAVTEHLAFMETLADL